MKRPAAALDMLAGEIDRDAFEKNKGAANLAASRALSAGSRHLNINEFVTVRLCSVPAAKDPRCRERFSFHRKLHAIGAKIYLMNELPIKVIFACSEELRFRVRQFSKLEFRLIARTYSFSNRDSRLLRRPI